MFKNPSKLFGFLQLSHSAYLTDAKNICKFQNVHHTAVLWQKLFICIRQKHHFITHYDTK